MEIGHFNPEHMTNQQVFDAGAWHLLTQMEKSTREEGSVDCLYSGPDGCICGAAPFVQNYIKVFEGQLYEMLPNQPETEAKELIDQLQGVHDFCDVSSWRDALLELAIEHSFDPSMVLAFEYGEKTLRGMKIELERLIRENGRGFLESGICCHLMKFTGNDEPYRYVSEVQRKHNLPYVGPYGQWTRERVELSHLILNRIGEDLEA